MAAGETIAAGTATVPQAMLGILAADAAVLQVGGERVVFGEPPGAASIDRLVPCLATLVETQAPPLVTDALPTLLATGLSADDALDPELTRLAVGTVYLPVGHRGGDFILWLRREQAATVRWAGVVGADGRRLGPDPARGLTPRGSFAEWRETVRGRSRPWHPAEIGAAQDLAQALPELLLHRAQHRLMGLAMHDPLTGLSNRAQLLERLREARVRGTAIGIIFVDLDHFKEVNDTYGHQAGDTLLVEAARRLRATVAQRSRSGCTL